MNIWIIGASSGIGQALAESYALDGYHVWISARNEQQLKSIAGSHVNLHVLPLDVTDEGSLQQAQSQLSAEVNAIDKVIINAGTCEYIDSYYMEKDKIRRVMETNFFGAINVVDIALPLLRKTIQSKQNIHPQLIFVGSSVSYQALPRAGAYGASKAAVRYFAETLRADIAHEGIDVRIVSPGFVKTPLTDKNDFPMPFILNVEEAVKRIKKGLNSSRFDIHFPRRFTWLLKFIAILPDSLRLKLIAKASRHDVTKVDNAG